MSEQMATTNIGMTKQNSTPPTSENEAEPEAGCRKNTDLSTLLEPAEAWGLVSHLPPDFSVRFITTSKSGFVGTGRLTIN